MSDELLHRYRCDRDRRSYERLFEENLPLVSSVCRRLLRDPHDVQDAIQETFLKLAGNVDSVNGSIGAWLAVTARTTSVDLIRRSIRQRNGKQALAHLGRQQVEYLAKNEAIRSRLHEGLGLIEPQSRELLVARFVKKIPLGVIAVQMRVSVPTVCRRVADAVRDLAQVLRELGIDAADDLAVAEHFGNGETMNGRDDSEHGGLRFAPDWQDAALTPLGTPHEPSLIPGWTRPIRVGVLVSYQTMMKAGINENYIGTKWQVHSRAYFPVSGLQLVGVIEPGSEHRGSIESALRDYGMLGGLVEADDESALGTLDVLLLGNNYAMSPSIARAINRAVRSGMGLINEYWIGGQTGVIDSRDMCELMLADSAVYSYHMPGSCGGSLPATVLQEHPLIPGLEASTKMEFRGCGPAYRPVPSARVLISKDVVIQPHEHRIPGLDPIKMPCYLLGNLGRGRVAAIHAWPHQWFIRNLSVSPDEYYTNLLLWLAGSR